ncbi:2-phospho-L-lactate transferase [Methanonatronarchaeum sp. AMET-Sl]|uniref:2-phospho-L-lactate transferase n=1 Tax=Methanonatronarchaeum sp. AMET-Sl TaxID=3037654 RepID=UPI00244DF131|nr:2-phospho-L-lactate transferase [Methanonatronarchaeum sp. AMET-Sl]WGI16660.1 2-phospho-L-lactate transferase [Methanonatronarchaeum sp. AMET-Sl]
MLFLSGGTGTPKLLRGFKSLLNERDIVVVANTADDAVISGNLVCPDLDTVIYTLAGLVDDDRWWGIEDDTFHTNRFLNEIGQNEYMSIGDRDRAIHIRRTSLLKEMSLSEATQRICSSLGIEASVFPMTDDKVRTTIISGENEFKFQEWLVKYGGEPKPDKVVFNGLDVAKPSPGFEEALESIDYVVIGPSNPVTSVNPIISLKGVRDKLFGKKVVAVSPLVNKKPFSGPADRLMEAFGIDTDNYGLKEFYGGLVDCFIYDERNENPPGDGVVYDTFMQSRKDEVRVAEKIMELFREM